MLSNPLVVETLRSVVAPCAAGGAFFLLVWRPWRRRAGEPDMLLSALVVAGAFAGGAILTHGWKGWWPQDFTGRIYTFVLMGLVVAVVDRFVLGRPKPVSDRNGRGRNLVPTILLGVCIVAMSGVLVWMMSESRIRYVWTGAERFYWPAAWTVVVAMGWVAIRNRASRGRGSLIPIACLAGLLAIVLVRAGNASLSQNTGPIIGCLSAYIVLQLWKGGRGIAVGTSHVVASAYLGLAMAGYLYSPEPKPHAALGIAAIAPLVLLVGELKPLKRLGATVRVALEIVLIGGLVIAAFVASAPESDGGGDNDIGDLYE